MRLRGGMGLLALSCGLSAGLFCPRVEAQGSLGPALSAPELQGARVLHDEARDDARSLALTAARERAEELRHLLAQGRGDEGSLLAALARADQALALAESLREAASLRAARARQEWELARAKQARVSRRLEAARRRCALVLGELSRETELASWKRLLGALGASAGGPGDERGTGRAAAVVSVRRETRLGQELGALVETARLAAARAATLRASADAAVAAEAASLVGLARQRLSRERELSSLRRQRSSLQGELSSTEQALQQMLAGLPDRPGLPGRRSPAQGLEVDLVDVSLLMGTLPWPLAAGAEFRITGRFGELTHPKHGTKTVRHGLLLAAKEGQPILAMAPGRVIYRDWYKGFGRALVLSHGHGVLSVHAHALSFRPEVGESVASGDVIGQVGDTGSLDGAQLYFQIQKDGVPRDPLLWLRGMR